MSQLGLPSSTPDLDDDQKALLLESYNADPVWSKRGEASADAPTPIRAGRLVLELYEGDVSPLLYTADKMCSCVTLRIKVVATW